MANSVPARNNLAYDSVHQVYLLIINRPPVTARFLTKAGVQIGSDFVISSESGYSAWASVAFGGPSNDPTFLVTYTFADLVTNPKYGRLVRYVPGGAPTISDRSKIADANNEWVQSEKAQNIWDGSQFIVGTRVTPAGYNEPVMQVNHFDLAGNVTAPVILGDGLDYEGSPALSCGSNSTCLAVGFLAGIPNGYTGGSYARLFSSSTLQGQGALFSLEIGHANQDQGATYVSHLGKFLTEWYRGPENVIDTRLVGMDGSMSTLDLTKGIGAPDSGCNAILYNPTTKTSLLVNKGTAGELNVMELGDDGYPTHNVVTLTQWDQQTSDYTPSIAVNAPDAQWLVTVDMGPGGLGNIVQGTSAGPVAPTITTGTTLPTTALGNVYNQALTASGGTQPYTWTLTAGTLPSGITLSGAALVGTPTAAGTFNFTLRVTGANSLFSEAAFSLTVQPSLLLNGSFTSGTDGSDHWLKFATPDMSGITWNVTNGIFQFYRTGTQAVVFQDTGVPVVANGPVQAQFDLGNSSTAPKTITVLLQNDDFSDLQMCRFTLQPGAPMRTYIMRSHTTQAWTSAMMSFYAATVGADGGFYRIGNVVMSYQANGSASETDCVDPTAPTSGGTTSGELITNGGFSSGLSPWGTFGNITSQLSGGVFQFYKVAGSPSGVVLQATNQAMAANQRMSSTFQLGNSSGIRQRVVVLLNDNSFADVQACTFWLAPNQALADYGITTYATRAWTNATISIYPASPGTSPTNEWLLLDNVSLKRTTAAVEGTQCFEPSSGITLQGAAVEPGVVLPPAARTPPSTTSPIASSGGAVIPSDASGWSADGFALASFASATGTGVGWRAVATTTDTKVLLWDRSIDLSGASNPHLTFQSLLWSNASTAEVQVSADGGVTWVPVAQVDPSSSWTGVDVDLSAFAGQVVYVEFVFNGVAPDDPIDGYDEWQIDQLQIDASSHAPVAARDVIALIAAIAARVALMA